MTPHRARADRRAGAALAEMAISLVVLWALLAAIVEFGRMLFASELLQLAARAAARQLALDDSLAAESSFEDALARIYDPQWLVLDLDRLETCGALVESPGGEAPLDRFARERLPLLNQQLRPLMISEDVPASADPEGKARRLVRYPGALLVRSTPPGDPCASDFTVAIPTLEDASGAARQQVHWLPVVEPIANATGGDRFPVSGGGLAAVRIHYPFQALLWSAAYPSPPDPSGRGNLGSRIVEKDVVEANAAARGGALIGARDALLGPYAGRFGAGVQLSVGERVRPYARVLRGEALFPREVVGL